MSITGSGLQNYKKAIIFNDHYSVTVVVLKCLYRTILFTLLDTIGAYRINLLLLRY